MANFPESSPPKPTILFADDDPMVCRAAKALLVIEGYRVLLAATGTETLVLFQENAKAIDVVILDHRMPGPGLVPLVAAIRLAAPRVGIVGSSGDTADIPSGLTSGEGAIQILAKPYRQADLLSVIKAALN